MNLRKNQSLNDTVKIPNPNLVNQQPHRRGYDRFCFTCKIIRIYKHNTSGLCPDCAADKRMKENLSKGFLE